MSDYDSDIQFDQSFLDDGVLCNWIRNCYINNYNIDKILNRLDYEQQLENKLEYLLPIHQQFDFYYYLIKQINQYIKEYQNIDLYLELLVKSQSFQNEILERCHLIITQTDSIYNLQNKIEQLFQIFYCLKDINMNILKQSNISLIFTLHKIITIYYPKSQYKSLFDKFDNFLRLIQASAQKLQYKNTPVYPISLEFIQFKGENKQIFGELQELDTKDKSLLKYLDQHFNILREDYIYDMRKSISYLSENGFYRSIKSEYINNIGLYQNITLKSFEMNNYDLLWKISLEQFNLDGRRQKIIDWKRSKKLSRGSLICITNVECHPLLFGVITSRSKNQDDYQNLNKINLEFRFLNPKSQIMNFLTLLTQKSILIEYQTQIEPSIYFLDSLKKIEKLPFDNLILKNQNQVFYPKYLQQNSLYQIDLSEKNRYYRQKVDVLKESWPIMESTLDDSQLKAIKLILSKEVALIKGPPGTGKTYCGVLAVRILCENLLENNFPILIVCQTNHALEKFLESLIQFVSFREIAKLGGVPKSPALKDIHFQYRSEIQFNWNQFKELKNQIRIIFNRLSQYDYFISAKDINKFWPELSHKLIHNFLCDNDLKKSQINVIQILNCWLNVKRPNNSMFEYNVERQGMRKYFRNTEITEQVFRNNILEKNYESYDDDYYNNESDEDLDNFLDFEDEYQQNEFDFQYENELDFQQENEIKLNYNKLKLHYNFQGIEKIQERIQEQKFNPWELNKNDILEIIKYLEYLKYKKDCLLFEDKYKQFKEMSQTLKNLYDDDEIKKLNQYKIIGVTVSSAARHLSKLQQLNSKVLVIEEAAEVLESHIACILMKNLQHLILIGDHYQLSPQLKCYDLKNKYNGNISLFERFYKNKIPSAELNFQRRMKTKFADFIRLIYGKQYLDHSYVEQNRNNIDIIGLDHDLLFFNHSWQESQDKKSKENIVEAEMIFQMVQYLIKVGYKQQQISVLSLYLRQANILQKLLIKKSLNQVNVQTVDNYQGEENDIVIISLVRNNQNTKNQLGFLGNQNRINVALSRAKIGLYVFGSFDFIKTVSSNGSLWQKILFLAETKQCLKDSITLKCLTHCTLRDVKKPNEWSKFNAGCCDKICNLKFEGCYHICQKQCHLGNHSRDQCPEQCQKILGCGHTCEQKCADRCICIKQLEILLDCNHKALIACGKNPAEVVCQEDLQLTFKECQHIVNYKCFQRENISPKCQQKCEKVLNCGHNCKKKCWEICQPCKDQCIKVKNCGHKCENLCYERCPPCNKQIPIKIYCGQHYIYKKCFEIQNLLILIQKITPYFLKSQIGQNYLNHLFGKLAEGCRDYLQIFEQKYEFNCRSPCQKPRECGHIFECKNLCSQECTPCEYRISITLECGHQYESLCKNINDFLKNFICKQKCIRQYQCGHQSKCKQLCFEKCMPCQEIVLKQFNCGHSVRTQCSNNYICRKQCNRKRECGHQVPCLNRCDQQCSPCQLIVKKTLVCGHQIMTECSSTNLQCQMKCQRQRACAHTDPCQNYCYQPCSPCLEQILFTLSCGHQILVQCYTMETTYQEQYGNQLYCRNCQYNFV